MSKVYVLPHNFPFKESIPGGVVMQPHEEVINTDIGKERVRAIVHLLVRAGSNDKLLAGGVLGQVEIGNELVFLCRGQLEELLSNHRTPFSAVGASVAKLALTAIIAHEVALTLAGPVVEDHGPVFSVIYAGKRELGTHQGVGDDHILASSSA